MRPLDPSAKLSSIPASNRQADVIILLAFFTRTTPIGCLHLHHGVTVRRGYHCATHGGKPAGGGARPAQGARQAPHGRTAVRWSTWRPVQPVSYRPSRGPYHPPPAGIRLHPRPTDTLPGNRPGRPESRHSGLKPEFHISRPKGPENGLRCAMPPSCGPPRGLFTTAAPSRTTSRA